MQIWIRKSLMLIITKSRLGLIIKDSNNLTIIVKWVKSIFKIWTDFIKCYTISLFCWCDMVFSIVISIYYKIPVNLVATSDLGLHCLPIFPKRDARLVRVMPPLIKHNTSTGKITVMTLSSQTDRSGQTVQTRGAVWSGSSLFAITFAAFGQNILWFGLFKF